MPETFLLLFAGGVMLSAAVPDPRAVTLRWLRLAGIIALTLAALSGVFIIYSQGWRRLYLLAPFVVAILGQLAFVQVARRSTQRAFATIASIVAIATATHLLIQILDPRAASAVESPFLAHTVLAVACALASATLGLALMDMLLGHAYLTASQMTIGPFLRLNRALAGAMIGRAVLSIGGTFLLQTLRPVGGLWNLFGIYIATRWLVGLLVPGLFVYMAHDCIRRRSTQSATGILYVAGVLILIGELIGLYLMSQTGRPI
jgi:hypothetical protein